MTYIHSNHKKNILNLVLGGLILTLLGGVFCLITLYNNVVNLTHNIATEKAAVDSIGAQNATLNNQAIAALSALQSANLASADGLVEDSHPQYYQQPLTANANQQSEWPIASEQ